MKCHLMHQFEKWIGSLSKGSFRGRLEAVCPSEVVETWGSNILCSVVGMVGFKIPQGRE